MPANPKYLSSNWTRVGKISSAFIGGYIVTTLCHMVVGVFLEDKTVLVMTAIWSSWIVWIACMLLAFYLKKAWHSWVIFLIITFVLAGIIYLRK